MKPEMKKRLEDAGFGVYDTPEELFAAIWNDPERPLPVSTDPDNKLELQNMKLKKALYSIINFEWNAWTEAKALLISIDGDDNGASISDQEKPGSSTL